jgi:hypothetical protein
MTFGKASKNMQSNLATARRNAILHILWTERYLTGIQLIAKVEHTLGKNCFGLPVQKNIFYRDMRSVKRSFRMAGQKLEYSRDKRRPGYYLHGQPDLLPDFKKLIKASVAETDQRQIDIYNRLSVAARFRQGCVISDTARNVVAYRILQEHCSLTLQEANRLALQRSYSL